jgi:GST-like protein
MPTTQTAPIDLHYWPTPNGWKISIMLEELGVPYALRPVNIGAGDQFKPAFLAIAPNNRMPAIVDPEGPGGAPISVFESGAILMYLGRKFDRFYPTGDERRRVAVEEWLMWQVGGVGPMFGQSNHFGRYAPERIPYAIKRYRDEVHRLFGVLNRRLDGREYVCDDYSIADMAIVGWASGYESHEIDIDEFPNAKRWLATMKARPAVERGLALGQELRNSVDLSKDEAARKVLFGQRGS